MDGLSTASGADLSFLLGWARAPERWRELLCDPEVEAESAAPGQVGVVLIGPSGALRGANSAGQAACERRLGLLESRGEAFLTPANHEAVDETRRALAERGGQVIVKLMASDNDGAVFAYLCSAGRLPPHLAGGLPAMLEGDVALVLPPTEAGDLLGGALRDSFGLTQAESRLAGLLGEGMSLQEAADELGVSVNTIRNQLRAVFEKMGLNRQSDLVRALSQLSTLAGLAREGPGIFRANAGLARSALGSAPAVQHHILADGRRLSWRDYGVRDGRPVLVVHQGLGGSLYPRGTAALARDLGLRLIVPARPGVGASDPRPRYSYEGVAADMIGLLDSLGVERLQIACLLDGAPYALATAAALGARAERLILINPRPPGWRTSVSRDVAHPLLQFRRRLASNPWLAEVVYPLIRRQLTAGGIERFVRAGASGTPADAAYLAAHPDLMEFSVEYVTEGFLANARGIIDSTKCAARSSPPDLGGIEAAITIWLGGEDPMLTEEEARVWLGEKLGELRMFPGAANFLAYAAWPEMLGWLADFDTGSNSRR